VSAVKYELGFVSKKTTFFIVTAVKTSNLTFYKSTFPQNKLTAIMLRLLIPLLQIMFEAAEKRNVKDCCEVEGRLSDLQRLNHGLDRCQRSLRDYLDAKRNVFPRFFFISDGELLSMLGSNDPSRVQEHLGKVSGTLCSRNVPSLVTFLAVTNMFPIIGNGLAINSYEFRITEFLIFILKNPITRKHNVSQTGSISAPKWGEGDMYSLVR
jgi:hypothetical protein